MSETTRFIIAITGLTVFAVGCGISIEHTAPGFIIALVGTVVNVIPITWRD